MSDGWMDDFLEAAYEDANGGLVDTSCEYDDEDIWDWEGDE
ncbi:hypothetical protein SEA_PARVUSTARDA_56 [Gordonia phage ParvusTarda]|uniref:Uncharacterized protein n=2 Tax=Lambovirus TaxID=2843412 RepID=A0A9E7U2M9_9CAUD|nr:hypothetical protein SEA_PARVUSTARDA_56 [Gordonia phage ParvusTarda]WNO26279.1 hypothetical protein SEA_GOATIFICATION_57 [Gordonia phage GOATification]WNO27171.1 hypothetical protein SEA_FULCRUM_57 [Gordonia phage Fulcrum]